MRFAMNFTIFYFACLSTIISIMRNRDAVDMFWFNLRNEKLYYFRFSVSKRTPFPPVLSHDRNIFYVCTIAAFSVPQY